MTSDTTDLTWHFLEQMMLIRRFEEGVCLAADEKQFPGHFHLYIGQEATGVGAMAALGAGDFIATTHRNHGHVLARGADVEACFAEIFGRATGLNGGRGGTIHLCDPALGFIQTSGVVGSVVGLAAGAAYTCKLRGDGRITAAFFGDGALEEGIAFEALNIASLWSLPIVFVCENNSAEALGMAKGGYPTLVHAANDLRSIPGSMGIEAVRVDGTDAFEVNRAMRQATDHARAGKGPIFIEAVTKRWAGSAPLWPELTTGVTDIRMATGGVEIPDGPHADWYRQSDPLLSAVRSLLASDPAAVDRVTDMDAAVRKRVSEAREAALAADFPRPETARDLVFAEGA